MRKLILLSIVLLLSFCQSPPSIEETPVVLHQPAEYDPQEAVWLIWPPVDHLKEYSNEQVVLQIIDAIIPHSKIMLTAANEEILKHAKTLLPKSALESGKIEMINLPLNDNYPEKNKFVYFE